MEPDGAHAAARPATELAGDWLSLFLAFPTPKPSKAESAWTFASSITNACVEAGLSEPNKIYLTVKTENNAPADCEDREQASGWIFRFLRDDAHAVVVVLGKRRSGGCALAMEWARRFKLPLLVLVPVGEHPTGLLPESERGRYEVVLEYSNREQASELAAEWVLRNKRQFLSVAPDRERRLAYTDSVHAQCREVWEKMQPGERQALVDQLGARAQEVESLLSGHHAMTVEGATDLLELADYMGVAVYVGDRASTIEAGTPQLLPAPERAMLEEAMGSFAVVRRNALATYELGARRVHEERLLALTQRRRWRSTYLSPFAWKRLAQQIERGDAGAHGASR
jgi:hypothetical protein